MKVNFEKIEFRNFMSFGNKLSVIDFKKGFNIVSGNNGSGKSSLLLDLISFNLYGKQYRKIKKKEDLVNRTNKKGLFTKSYFTIGKDRYSIERGMKPKLLRFFKNDEELDLLSGDVLTQEEIEKIIGVNHIMFKQIVSTAVNHNKPFLTLPTPEKRTIVENLFGLELIPEMLKIVKSDRSESNIKLNNNEVTLKSTENMIENLENQIKEANKMLKVFEEEKNKSIANLKNKINECNNSKASIEKRIEDLNIKLKEFSIEEVLKKIESLNQESNELNQNIGESRALISNLRPNENQEDFDAIIAQLKKQLEELIANKENISKEQSKLSEILEQKDLKELKTSLEINTNKLNDLYSESGNLKGYMKSLLEDLETLKDIDICTNCKQKVSKEHKEKEINSIKTKLMDFNGQLEKIIEEQKTTEELIKSTNLSINEYEQTLRNKKDIDNKLDKIKGEIEYLLERHQDKTNKKKDFEQKQKESKEKIKEITEKLNLLIVKQKDLNEKIEKEKQTENEFKKIKDENYKESIELNRVSNEILNLENALKEKEESEINIDLDNLSRMLNEKTEIRKDLIVSLDTEREYQKIYDFCIDLLSDNGVKTDFYSIVVPALNQKINEFLKSFELPVLIRFNNNLDYEIISVNSNESIDYYAFSEGEKKRIDISIMLAFIKLSKIITNWECNVIVFDEILDGAIDKEGLSTIMESIRNIVINNSNICAYVISHRIEDSMFDNKLYIEKKKGFSEIKYI